MERAGVSSLPRIRRVVDDKSQQTRKLSNLVETLEIGDKAKAASVTTDEALKEQLESIGYAHVLWKTFKSPHKHADFLIVAFRHQGNVFGQEARDLLDRFSEAAGKSLDTAFHYHALPFRWFTRKSGPRDHRVAGAPTQKSLPCSRRSSRLWLSFCFSFQCP